MTHFQEVIEPQENFPHIYPNALALLEPPRDTDGAAIHNLIRCSPFLDDNSLYCYLMVCSHFSETSVVARIDNELAGVITAYIPPEQPDTLFVWQVAVAKTAQRRGLARSMLEHVLQRNTLQHIKWLETTVTLDNQASRGLFDSLAKRQQCDLQESIMFDRKEHFNNLHDSEYRLCIGPISRKSDSTGAQ
jgi:L-2,4-diaminobutyric acid acetyltransferase